MKKFFVFLTAVCLLFSISGCGQKTAVSTENLLPVDDRAEEEIRRAISLLLDREYIARSIAQGGQQPASTFVPKGLTDADGSEFYSNTDYFDPSQSAYEENFARAIETLRKYYSYDEKNGKFQNFPTLQYLYNNSDAHRAVGEYVQNILSGVGIRVSLENQEWNTFLNTRKQGDYTLARNGWVADYNDPICFLDMWTTTSGNNDIQFGKGDHASTAIYDLDLTPYGVDYQITGGTWAQTYDVLIDAIKHQTDRQSRYAMMHLAEDMLMQTGCITPLYYYTDPYMVHSSVEGFYTNLLGYKFFHATTVNGDSSSISVCLASEPDSLDPAFNSTVDGATLLSHLFAGLAKWSANDQGSLTVTADCAEDLPEGIVNDDGTVTYTYRLKENLKWSDGQPLTAQDFVYAWKRAASDTAGAGQGYLFRVIAGYGTEDLAVSAPDSRTLTVTLTNPIGYWNELLATPTFFPVREDIVTASESWAYSPKTYVGNGAYKMTGWEHNSVITLEKNEFFYDAGSVIMEQIRFYLSDDTNNMLSNYKNGAWLVIDNIPTNEIPALQQQYGKEFVIADQLGTYYLCWNINADLSAK